MISQWYELKPKAITLRKKGKSIKYVSKTLGIPLSTLSGWFKNIKLTPAQEKILRKNHENGLIKARVQAVKWHNKQKALRLKDAEDKANNTLSRIPLNTENIELALALLYLGEGFKKNSSTGMGNSDPLILRFFLDTVVNIYGLDIEKIRFDLHLRADQNAMSMKKYWSQELNIPISKFKYILYDKRTTKSETYKNYKGVCSIECGNIAIQRKLLYISRKFCGNVIKNMRG